MGSGLPAGGWVAIVSLAIGLLIRLLKTDKLNAALAGFGVPPVPKRWLPWAALGLGIASSALDAHVNGTPWAQALGGGAIAAFGAIAAHELGVESLRDGKEIGE